MAMPVARIVITPSSISAQLLAIDGFCNPLNTVFRGHQLQSLHHRTICAAWADDSWADGWKKTIGLPVFSNQWFENPGGFVVGWHRDLYYRFCNFKSDLSVVFCNNSNCFNAHILFTTCSQAKGFVAYLQIPTSVSSTAHVCARCVHQEQQQMLLLRCSQLALGSTCAFRQVQPRSFLY